MSEVIIFCESFLQVKNALYLVTKNYKEHPVTLVISGHEDLLKLFHVVNEKAFVNAVNIVHVKAYPARMARTTSLIIKALYLLPDIASEKRYLRNIYEKHLAFLSGNDVYFFDRCFNPITFYFLKKLSKANRITFMPDSSYDVIQRLKSYPRNIKELAVFLSYKLIYGYDLTMIKYPYLRGIPTIPDRFFRDNVTKIIDKEESGILLQDFDTGQFKIMDTDEYRVMYFDTDLVNSAYISDSDAVLKVLNGVFNSLSKFFPEETVALKYHPDYQGDKNLIKFGHVLPDYIPGEFLYDPGIVMYFGFYSMALSNVKTGLTVSLIDLVNFDRNETREQIKSELIQLSCTDILFPQSLDEFEGILAETKEKQSEARHDLI
ncbi:hypothetical protein ACFLWR_01425 [Chloroflexota bacterium]